MKTPQESTGIIFNPPSPVTLCIGLDLFTATLREQGVEAIPIHWRPPHNPPQEIKKILDQLL